MSKSNQLETIENKIKTEIVHRKDRWNNRDNLIMNNTYSVDELIEFQMNAGSYKLNIHVYTAFYMLLL